MVHFNLIIIIFYPLIIDYQEKTKKFLTDKIDIYILRIILYMNI